MPGREPRPGDIYQHFKGNKYQVTAIAYDAETEEKCVVYQALYGEFKTFVRKYDEFISEVDREKYPQVNCRYRFSSLEEMASMEDFASSDELKNAVKKEQEAESAGDKKENVETEMQMSEPMPGYEMRELKHPEDEGEVNPDLLAFLEAETTREKIEVLDRIKERITESLLCAIEASMDISYEDENLEERVYYIKNYLRTRERYEGTRLR